MLKVLVVEDEELIRKGIVLAVDWAALDCVVVGEASNGEEALAAVERLSPSLIITDLKMPRMDGIEMLRRLREAGNPVYVIILTAYDSFTYAQSALRLGAVDFLLKPFHDGELEQAVRNLQSRQLVVKAAQRRKGAEQLGPAGRRHPGMSGRRRGPLKGEDVAVFSPSGAAFGCVLAHGDASCHSALCPPIRPLRWRMVAPSR